MTGMAIAVLLILVALVIITFLLLEYLPSIYDCQKKILKEFRHEHKSKGKEEDDND